MPKIMSRDPSPGTHYDILITCVSMIQIGSFSFLLWAMSYISPRLWASRKYICTHDRAVVWDVNFMVALSETLYQNTHTHRHSVGLSHINIHIYIYILRALLLGGIVGLGDPSPVNWASLANFVFVISQFHIHAFLTQLHCTHLIQRANQ